MLWLIMVVLNSFRYGHANFGCGSCSYFFFNLLKSNIFFKDVHTELIQHRRSWMLKRRVVKGKLFVNSAEQRRNGSCPLMPEEVFTVRQTKLIVRGV